MTLPLFEETYTVSRLCEEVKSFLAEAFSSIWVAGEVQRLRESRAGHLYFELVEKDDADHVCGKLDAALWRGDRWRIERALGGAAALAEALSESTDVRLRADVDFYGPAGRLQLAVREVDPVYTLGLLERRRRETLAALAAAGLLEANRALDLAEAPLSIALVTSHGSAAYHDFVTTLGESGWGFRVLLLHAAVQGRGAEREVASALAEAGRSGADCVVLVRGGGARSDLAVFDRAEVAEAVARCPLPVVTGLGHEIDESIADRVAHTPLKTPTQAAAFLVDRVDRAERARAELSAGIARVARERLRAERERIAHAEKGVDLARFRLAAAGERLRSLAGRLAEAAPRPLSRGAVETERLAGEIARRAGARLAAAESRLGGLERLCVQLSPARVLERGYSITRDATGAVLRDPARVAPGDLVVTTLSGGILTSRVPHLREE